MPELINFRDLEKPGNPQEFPSWLLVTMVTLTESEHVREVVPDPTQIEWDCRINGHTVPFDRFCERMQQEIDWEQNRSARKLLEEKLGGPIGEKFAAISDLLERFERTVRQELGLQEEQA